MPHTDLRLCSSSVGVVLACLAGMGALAGCADASAPTDDATRDSTPAEVSTPEPRASDDEPRSRFAALEHTLRRAGHSVPQGGGVDAALDVYAGVDTRTAVPA